MGLAIEPGTGITRSQTAIVQSRYGLAEDVLTISTTYPVDPPLPDQIQIRVKAASLNPIDWQMWEGNRRLIAKRAFPFAPLFDVAGEVAAVGGAVARFRIGDRVYADNEKHGGGGAERVNIDEALVSHIPDGLGYREAAAVPLAAQTALLTLDAGGMAQGARVCVIGASGGVGSFAVQIARALGAAEVMGVCSGRNAAYVADIGATRVIDYTQSSLSDALDSNSLDIVVDCVGGRNQWLDARNVLVPGGRFVTISRDEDGVVGVASAARMVATILSRQLRSRWGARIAYVPVFLKASHELLDRVSAMIDTGQIASPRIASFYRTLPGLLDAVALSKSGRAVGKIVLLDPEITSVTKV